LGARASLGLAGSVGAAVGAFVALIVPLRAHGAWTTVAAGVCVLAVVVQLGTGPLLAAPPASRAARRWWANVHQAGALLLVGLGIRAVDQWHHTPATERTWLALALPALGCLAYLSVRLGMTARFLRPGREWTAPPAAPAGSDAGSSETP